MSRIEVIRFDRPPYSVNGVWTEWQLSGNRQEETEFDVIRRPIPHRLLSYLFQLLGQLHLLSGHASITDVTCSNGENENLPSW